MEIYTKMLQFGSDLFNKMGHKTSWMENNQAFEKAWS